MILDFIQVNKIKGYEDIKDFYVICSDGRIINTDRLIYLKISLDSNGYPFYRLHVVNGKKKNVKIHRLLAKWLIPNPNNLPIVRHLDDNKMNWNLSNLVWGTRSNNEHDKKKNRGSYSGSVADPIARAKARAKSGAKLSKPVRCVETGEIYPSVIEANRQTCINHASISQCCNGKQHTAGNLHWEWYYPQQASANIVDMSDYLEINTSYRIN